MPQPNETIEQFLKRGGKVKKCPPAAVSPVASGVKLNRRQLGEMRQHVEAQEATRLKGVMRMYPNAR